MLTMTIGILVWIGAGMIAALAIGRASTIGADAARARISARDLS
jgi:hypothetical protein